MICCKSRMMNQRGGFTLIELLMVISIIAVLMSLLTPAVMDARSAARLLQCKNRLKNLSLGLHGVESSMKRFPASGNFSPTSGGTYHSWVVDLLPHVDRIDLFDRYDRDDFSTSSGNRELTNTHLPVLVCPDDPTIVTGNGNLSYVVNAGFGYTVPVDCPVSIHTNPGVSTVVSPFDLNGDGVVCAIGSAPSSIETDEQIFKRTGLFFSENWPIGSGTVRHHSMDTISDGTSNTIMMTENVRAGYNSTDNNNWGSPEPRHNSFMVSSYVCPTGSCVAGGVEYANSNNRGATPYSYESLNSSLVQSEGWSPWPSAYHHGKINFAFCDGHVRSISEEVDGIVYAALCSPQGEKLTGTLRQDPVSGASF